MGAPGSNAAEEAGGAAGGVVGRAEGGAGGGAGGAGHKAVVLVPTGRWLAAALAVDCGELAQSGQVCGVVGLKAPCTEYHGIETRS
jgi:hypothetical protein